MAASTCLSHSNSLSSINCALTLLAKLFIRRYQSKALCKFTDSQACYVNWLLTQVSRHFLSFVKSSQGSVVGREVSLKRLSEHSLSCASLTKKLANVLNPPANVLLTRKSLATLLIFPVSKVLFHMLLEVTKIRF